MRTLILLRASFALFLATPAIAEERVALGGGLAIESWKVRKNGIGTVIVEGTARNTGSEELDRPRIGVSVTGDKGFVGSGSSRTDAKFLAPGAMSPFSVYLDDADNGSGRFTVEFARVD